jgi:lipoate-protein ligase A
MHQLAVEPIPSAASQLVRERQLFALAERGLCGELFHCWETHRPAIVLGRSRRAADDVFDHVCAADRVPILRRITGGGTVVLGPGCLNYVVVLSIVSRPELAEVAASFRAVLGGLASALELPGLIIEGQTDLVLDGRKVSGNAQRRGRRTLFHHGTLLYDFDAGLAARYLKEPGRQPAYRGGRCHLDFLGNLPLPSRTIRARLLHAWMRSALLLRA